MSCSDMRFRIMPCSHYDDQAFWKNRYKVVKFPCGKCPDCTKARQNDIAVRAGYESMNYSHISFCRLSYKDLTLPLSAVPYLVLPDGTKVQDGPRFMLEGDFLNRMREEMSLVPNSVILGKSRYIHFDVPGSADVDCPGSKHEYIITPSVDIRDPRLWLKNCRVAYKRQFGKDLPDFKYLMCAEYGSRYTRPHYHYLFLGLSPDIVDWMLARWEARYGLTNRKTVRNSPKDKFRVASYISKYMAKGEFEAPAVTAGIAVKGRYCASRCLGKSYIQDKQSYFLAFDLFGAYDLDTLRYVRDNSLMSDAEVNMVVKSIIDRMSIQVPGFDFRFPLPKSWKYLMYYKKVHRCAGSIKVEKIDTETSSRVVFTDSYRYVPFKIFRVVQKTLQDNAISDDLRKLQNFVLSLPSSVSYAEANFRFKQFKKICSEQAEASTRQNLRNFYSKDSQ